MRDLNEFMALQDRHKMMEVLDEDMKQEGLSPELRATLTLRFGIITAQALQDGGDTDLADGIMTWLNMKHPELIEELQADMLEMARDMGAL